jgi:hypothetical protein
VEVWVVGCDGGREGSAGHRVEESSAVVPEWGRGADEAHALGRLAPDGVVSIRRRQRGGDVLNSEVWAR